MPQSIRVKHRRGTSAQWTESDVILEDGEIAIDDVGNGMRALLIGDGVHLYTELPKIYLREVLPRMVTLSLPTASWVGIQSPYSQDVVISGVTVNSKVDLQPTETIIQTLRENEISLTTKNENGVISIVAIGAKPSEDMSIQASVVEVTS